MEFFNKAKIVRLRSHLEKFLVADEDEVTVRQNRNGSSPNARWRVELVEGDTHLIRLKSCHGLYLAASDEPFLFGMTGKKVIQERSNTKLIDNIVCIQWEPIRDGGLQFQVKLRSKAGGKFLRANGGTPPWRNSVTHDVPHRTATQDWVLWSVEVLDIIESDSIVSWESSSPISSLSSNFSCSSDGSLSSKYSTSTDSFSRHGTRFRKVAADSPDGRESIMELFQNAKTVRLRSYHDKFLLADSDEESVSQDRDGDGRNARWTVELGQDGNVIRLKSRYNKYLTATNQPMLLGMTGKKVAQTIPSKLDSAVEWEPIREGVQVRLKTRYGQFLRGNGGLPPWRNSITHDIPHRTATQDWVLWDVEVLERRSVLPPKSSDPESESKPISPSSSLKAPRLAKLESYDSSASSPVKSDGRVIHYNVADENENFEFNEESWFHFNGNGVEELKQKLAVETGLQDFIVCARNPLNGELYPIKLHLPPNHAKMHVVVVVPSSKVQGSKSHDYMKKSGPSAAPIYAPSIYVCTDSSRNGCFKFVVVQQ